MHVSLHNVRHQLGQCCRHGLFKFHRVSLFLCLFDCLFVWSFLSFFIQTPTQNGLSIDFFVVMLTMCVIFWRQLVHTDHSLITFVYAGAYAHYMLTLRIRPVLQSSSIWVSTALAAFACKRKPLTVYLELGVIQNYSWQTKVYLPQEWHQKFW